MQERDARREPAPYLEMYAFSEGGDAELEFEDAIVTLNQRFDGLRPRRALSNRYVELVEKAQRAADERRWVDARRHVRTLTLLVNHAVELERRPWLGRVLVLLPLPTVAVLGLIQELSKAWSPSELIAGSGASDYVGYLWAGALGGAVAFYWKLFNGRIAHGFSAAYALRYFLQLFLSSVLALFAVLVIKYGVSALTDASAAIVRHSAVVCVAAFAVGFFGTSVLRFAVRTNDARSRFPVRQDKDEPPQSESHHEPEHPCLP